MTDEQRLDVTETAAALGMTRSAVRKAIWRQALRAESVPSGNGYKYLVPIAEVERYRTENRKERKA